MDSTKELPVIQRVYDLTLWFVPFLHRLPRDHQFRLGARVEETLYDLLEALVQARYRAGAAESLERASGRLDLLRYQVRLLVDLSLMDERRYEHVSGLMGQVSKELGGWLRYRRGERAAAR